MSARIDICNFALTLLGESRIATLEDDSDKARAMKDLYYIARDAMMESADWTFATKRFMPVAASDAPTWGWAYAFPIPSDIIRVLEVDRNSQFQPVPYNDMSRDPVDHLIEGNNILCNEETIYCTGVRKIEDEGIYSPLFVEAFAAHLAYLAALPLTASRGIKEDTLKLAQGALKQARSRDGMQNTTRRIRNRALSRVRY